MTYDISETTHIYNTNKCLVNCMYIIINDIHAVHYSTAITNTVLELKLQSHTHSRSRGGYFILMLGWGPIGSCTAWDSLSPYKLFAVLGSQTQGEWYCLSFPLGANSSLGSITLAIFHLFTCCRWEQIASLSYRGTVMLTLRNQFSFQREQLFPR